MTQHPATTTPGLSGREAERLADALEARDVTVFVDGTSLRLPEGARDAVVDLLSRMTRGETVTVTSAAVTSAAEPPAATDWPPRHPTSRSPTSSAPSKAPSSSCATSGPARSSTPRAARLW